MIICGDALTELKKLDGGIVQTCITSPPYWGLRDYGVDGQLGLESTPEEYIARLVEIFAEVKRVLRDDGTLWLVLGDSYAGQGRRDAGFNERWHDKSYLTDKQGDTDGARPHRSSPGLKPKDLCMIPARVALALQADGWWLRSDIIWAKPNPMPESVTDRPTSAHEHIFLLAKSQRYFYDADAIREPHVTPIDENGIFLDCWGRPRVENRSGDGTACKGGSGVPNGIGIKANPAGRNKRNVWTVATKPYPEAHFAVYPPALIEPCVLAGSAGQACEICGAPWERVTESERGFDDQNNCRGCGKPRSKHVQGAKSALLKHPEIMTPASTTILEDGAVPCGANKTTGFQPTCSCDNEGTGQSIILDPFMGSGTTGEVALKHRRKFIGIELNPEYVKLSEKRLREVEMVMF